MGAFYMNINMWPVVVTLPLHMFFCSISLSLCIVGFYCSIHTVSSTTFSSGTALGCLIITLGRRRRAPSRAPSSHAAPSSHTVTLTDALTAPPAPPGRSCSAQAPLALGNPTHVEMRRTPAASR